MGGARSFPRPLRGHLSPLREKAMSYERYSAREEKQAERQRLLPHPVGRGQQEMAMAPGNAAFA